MGILVFNRSTSLTGHARDRAFGAGVIGGRFLVDPSGSGTALASVGAARDAVR